MQRLLYPPLAVADDHRPRRHRERPREHGRRCAADEAAGTQLAPVVAAIVVLSAQQVLDDGGRESSAGRCGRGRAGGAAAAALGYGGPARGHVVMCLLACSCCLLLYIESGSERLRPRP